MVSPPAGTASTFFSPRGPLARVLHGYEERPAQARLAAAVARVLTDGGTLLAEAGTGTGKTLAYLLPAVELGRRVVISTGTRNLQEQLLGKDIPDPRPRPGARPERRGHEGTRETTSA